MSEYATLTNDSQLHNASFDKTWEAFSPSNISSINVLAIESETDKSWKLKVKKTNGDDICMWFPKSKCKLKNNILYVPMWLLQKKNNNLKK